MRKRFIAIILFAFLCIIFPMGKSAYASSESDFVITDGLLFRYKGNDTLVSIPDTVTEIYEGAFFRNNQLKSITIPGSVKRIGRNAFGDCENLTTVTMQRGLKEIGMFAFDNCTSLKKIVLPEGIEILDNHVFRGSGLEEITIPDSIIGVGYGCINDTPLYQKARSTDKLLIRGPVLFYGYHASGKVTIPSKVKVIAKEAFKDNPNMTSVVIPSSVKEIPYRAFSYCNSLSSVTIQKGVEVVGDSAFAGCEKLKAVSLPSTVKSIDGFAFEDTPWLAAQGSNGPLMIINHVLIDGKQAKGAITIPSHVTKIAADAFTGNTKITSVTIPGSVKTIEAYAFNSATNLKTVVIKEGVKTLKEGAFYLCDNIVKVTLPNSITRIEPSTFQGCKNLKSITLGNKLTYIGKYAFYYCLKLESIKLPSTLKTIGNRAFDSCDSLKEVTIPDQVTKIPKSLFSGCNNLKKVTLSKNLVEIGNNAFNNCYNLQSIVIPDKVTTIGNTSFSGCINMTSCKLSESLTSIGDFAFAGCWNLKDITLPSGVQKIGAFAFYSCNAATKLKQPEGIKVGYLAFYGTGDSLYHSNGTTYLAAGTEFPRLKKFASGNISSDKYWGEDSKDNSAVADALLKADTFMENVIGWKYPSVKSQGLWDYGYYCLLDLVDNAYSNMFFTRGDGYYGVATWMPDPVGYYVPNNLYGVAKCEAMRAFLACISSEPEELFRALYDSFIANGTYGINSKTWVTVGDSKVRYDDKKWGFHIKKK